MWDAVEVAQFRRLRALKLDGLGAINLFVGPNNSGKTSVLEALAVMSNPLDVWNWIEVARSREIKSGRTPVEELLKLYFPQRQSELIGWTPFLGKVELAYLENGNRNSIEATLAESRFEPASQLEESQYPVSSLEADEPTLKTRFEVSGPDGGHFTTEIQSRKEFSPPQTNTVPTRQATLITTVSHRTDLGILKGLSRTVEAGGKDVLVGFLSMLDPSIVGLEIVSPSGRSAVAKIQRDGIGFVPLNAEGDAIRRAVAIGASIMTSRGGILLIDEIDLGIHTAAIRKLLPALLIYMFGNNIQVFATTHSLDALDAVLEVNNMLGSSTPVSVYRLPEPGGANEVRRFSGQDAERIRTEYGYDLR